MVMNLDMDGREKKDAEEMERKGGMPHEGEERNRTITKMGGD